MQRANPRPRTADTLFFLILLIATPSVIAQSTWNGTASTNWNTAANWNGGVPAAATDVIIPSGTPNSPSTSGVTTPVCRSLVVNAGATLTIASGSPIAVSQNMTIAGTVSGAGSLRLVGSVMSDFGGGGTVGPLEIAKVGLSQARVLSNLTVGSLTLTSGDLFVSAFGSFTLAVNGDAQFLGGLLTNGNAGVIDVAGNVTFSGTTVTATPQIHCRGNWTSDSNYAPTTGTVIFDKTGAQTVSAAGPFPNVTIASSSTTSTSALHVLAALAVDGSLSVTPGTLDADGAVTVSVGASLTLGNATNTFGANLTVNGSLSAGGTIVFDGASMSDVITVASFPAMQVAKTGVAQVRILSNLTVGSLTQTSGDLFVSAFGSFTLTVNGNAQFQGGVVSNGNAGVIDVAGNVTFSGTTVTATPQIHCRGNWTSDSNYAPTTGTVIFDKTGAQTVSAAGPFPNVTIASSSTTSMSALHVLAALTVDGSLSVTPGALDADGAVIVSAGASLTLGNATNTFGANLTVNGSLSAGGTIVFDGPVMSDVITVASFPAMQVAKTGVAQVRILSNLTVGSLTQTSGDLFVSAFATFTLTVNGNAQFQGGILTNGNAGVIDVVGNVTFSGTTVTDTPQIHCHGNWTSDANYAPILGTVELDGASPTTLTAPVAGGTLTFANLVIKNGTRSLANDFTIAAQAITIDPSGTFAINGGRHLRVNRTGTTAFNVNGTLSVATNSELSMGPQTSMSVGATGTLSLVGTSAQPAKITGEAGGGYALTVNGTLAAKDFLVKEMGPGGMVIDFGATIAAAPNDFRNGTLDFRTGAPAGSVLLDVRRNAPAILTQLTFLNTPSAVGVFNVKTVASSVPISLTNWTGAFAGPSFENDPNGLITWNGQAAPALAAFAVIPGAELADIVWTMANQTGVASFQVRRGTSAAGPFPVILTPGVGGPGYGFVDQPLPANQARHYLLYASMTGGELLLLASGSATPYSAAPPPNVYKVGNGGPFADIQSAINAATDPSSVVWVTPGTYASFAIGATAPSNLHVLGFGTGPITIDTSSGPITISNVPASSGIELSNLTVGNASTNQNGIVVTLCACPVVLDQLSVSCNGTHTAVQVSTSPSTAIQRSAISGGTGLNVTAGSHVAISRGSLSSLVGTGSTIEMASLSPGSVNVTPAGSLLARTGVMPDLNLPELAKLSQPFAMFLDAFPNSPYIVVASPRLGYTTFPQFEMPVLVDAFAMAELPPMFTDVNGVGVIGFEIAPNPALLGFTYVVQAGCLDPNSGVWRFSNVETMVGMP